MGAIKAPVGGGDVSVPKQNVDPDPITPERDAGAPPPKVNVGAGKETPSKAATGTLGPPDGDVK